MAAPQERIDRNVSKAMETFQELWDMVQSLQFENERLEKEVEILKEDNRSIIEALVEYTAAHSVREVHPFLADNRA